MAFRMTIPDPRPSDHPLLFPTDFTWGAATAAYQIEGSPLADGAGASNWHRFAHTPRMIRDGTTGDIACDHYHRSATDLDVMRTLGLTGYRFSIAWSRILPDGRGTVNRAGLSFYDRLVDALLGSNIQPMITLFHWDLPAALEDRGGWLNPDCAAWFGEYAEVMFRALDDRVPRWVTLNEPWVVADGGYLHGVHAPGHRSPFEATRASHNLLRAHAAGVAAYRASGQHHIGLVVNLEPKYAASARPNDQAATARADAYMNRYYLDPVFGRGYPDELPRIFGEAWPIVPDADLDAIRAPVDFLGINYYTRGLTRFNERAYPLRASTVRRRRATYTEMGWEVYPRALTDVLLWVQDRYGPMPLYITENGAAFYDPPSPIEGRVEDPLRTAYLRSHLIAVRDAIQAGADVRGYYVWSLLDNFEWSQGYTKRFGITHVDYATQRRTIKASGEFYAEVIRTRGEVLRGEQSSNRTIEQSDKP
jgi:beta-glucosidase